MHGDHWNLGRWNRIPVAMHWTVLLSFAWLYLFLWDLLATAIASVALFALFVAHELGHVAMLRWRGIAVARITLNGIHGETEHGYASAKDEALVAWGGVLAQIAVLALSYAFVAAVDLSSMPAAMAVAGPVLLVWAKLNIFLLVIALLPIGPFDGRKAWAVIGLARAAMRSRRRTGQVPKLTTAQQRELEARAHVEAADLIERLRKKSDTRKEGA